MLGTARTDIIEPGMSRDVSRRSSAPRVARSPFLALLALLCVLAGTATVRASCGDYVTITGGRRANAGTAAALPNAFGQTGLLAPSSMPAAPPCHGPNCHGNTPSPAPAAPAPQFSSPSPQWANTAGPIGLPLNAPAGRLAPSLAMSSPGPTRPIDHPPPLRRNQAS